MHEQHGRNYAFFDAPVGLIFTIDRVMQQGSWLDYGMFLQNIMVAARARGLDTCPQAAFTQFHRIIEEQLGLPPTEMVVCGMSLGHADPARSRTAGHRARAGRGASRGSSNERGRRRPGSLDRRREEKRQRPRRTRASPASIMPALGIPFDFVLFALTLLGVALLHHHALQGRPIGGALAITLYQLLVTGFKAGAGVGGPGRRTLGHEWVTLANLLGLLLGFALLADHFEKSRAARRCCRTCCPTTGRAASCCWSACS